MYCKILIDCLLIQYVCPMICFVKLALLEITSGVFFILFYHWTLMNCGVALLKLSSNGLC